MRSNNLTDTESVFTLAEIADLIHGELVGDSSLQIRGACGFREASDCDLSYLSSAKHEADVRRSKACAVIVSKDSNFDAKPVIKVENPAQAFLKVVKLWATGLEDLDRTGIHPTAFVDQSAVIGEDVYLGPFVTVGKGSVIAKGSSILSHSSIGEDVRIGSDTLIYENVVIRDRSDIRNHVIIHAGTVIGADGFGYEQVDGKHVKVPQQGNVCIESDVEIGANVCIDRARFGSTVIGEGSKIDNLVQIAHNVRIGKKCLIISQVGIAGSSQIGDGVILAGQVGVSGHVKIGDGTIVGAQSGVFTDVEGGQILLGSPPLPIREEKQRIVYNSRLPQLFKDFKELKKKLD